MLDESKVQNFQWQKGVNDLEYIAILEKLIETDNKIIKQATSKIRELAKENARLKALDKS